MAEEVEVFLEVGVGVGVVGAEAVAGEMVAGGGVEGGDDAAGKEPVLGVFQETAVGTPLADNAIGMAWGVNPVWA